MKKITFLTAMLILGTSAFANTPSLDRRSMASQMGNSNRAVLSKNQINAMANNSKASGEVLKSSVKYEKIEATLPTLPILPPVVDDREKEKAACVNNNVGIGNTFVWASKFSNTNDYTTMIEDIKNPENNICFVKVELKSSDSKIDVSDIKFVYYEMGRNITCGEWTDGKIIERRALDAKKSARTWGTVAGAVGGAGVGVGAMELFGNKLIGGSVQGQKSKKLGDDELLRSQILVLKDKDRATYNNLKNNLYTIKDKCEKDLKDVDEDKKPDECRNLNYDFLLSI